MCTLVIVTLVYLTGVHEKYYIKSTEMVGWVRQYELDTKVKEYTMQSTEIECKLKEK